MGEDATHKKENIDVNDVSTKENKTDGGKKALSIVALVFGILGLVFFWTGFFALACCLAGVIVGIIALVKKSQKGMAIAGLVCGGIGLIPAILFSFLWGGAAVLFGGLSNDLDAYTKDPSGFCQKNPSSYLCDTSNSEPTNNTNNTETPTKPASKWSDVVNDIYDGLAAEDDDIEDIPEDDMKEAINNLVVCLNNAGMKIDSLDDLDALEDDDENEKANDCVDDFEEDIYKLVLDNI